MDPAGQLLASLRAQEAEEGGSLGLCCRPQGGLRRAARSQAARLRSGAGFSRAPR